MSDQFAALHQWLYFIKPKIRTPDEMPLNHILAKGSKSKVEVPAVRTMKPVDVPKRHIANLSKALTQCGPQASAYGKCVSVKAEVTKHVCSKEFEALINCIKKASKKL